MRKPWAFPADVTPPPPPPTTTHPPPTPTRLDADLDEAGDADEGWLAQGLSERISDGLACVAASLPSGALGVSDGIIKQSTTTIAGRLSSHAMFNTAADAVARAFGCVRGQVHAFLSNKKIGLIDPGSESF